MIKKLLAIMPAAALLFMPALASAHVIVTPLTANVGQELTFSVSVPNEKETPVTTVVLDIPKGVEEVVPTVKAGWTITVATNGDAKDPEATAITWANGSIPVGQRDDFSFSAQVPASATELDWKAYQTYGNGSIVHWDQKPAGSDDATGDAGPYSITKVSNDLTASTTNTKASSSSNSTVPLVLSILAVIICIGTAVLATKNK